MKRSNIYTVGFKRKRKGLTDYRKRIRILSSNKPRLVVRKSLKNTQASIVEYNKKGDLVELSSHSRNLKKFGWTYNTGNLPAAYLVGYLLGKKAKNAKLDEAIMDIGFHKSKKGSRIYAVLAGALDAGLKVAHSKEILPTKERIMGLHIVHYAETLKKDEPLFKKQFGNYLKSDIDPKGMAKKFQEVKNNIEHGGK